MGRGYGCSRAHESDWGSDLFTGDECLFAGFVLVLPIAAVVVIDIQVWSPAGRADSILWVYFLIAALNRFNRLTVFPLVIFEEELPVLLYEGFDDRRPVDGKFLVFGGMGIIKSLLFEWDVSTDEAN